MRNNFLVAARNAHSTGSKRWWMASIFIQTLNSIHRTAKQTHFPQDITENTFLTGIQLIWCYFFDCSFSAAHWGLRVNGDVCYKNIIELIDVFRDSKGITLYLRRLASDSSQTQWIRFNWKAYWRLNRIPARKKKQLIVKYVILIPWFTPDCNMVYHYREKRLWTLNVIWMISIIINQSQIWFNSYWDLKPHNQQPIYHINVEIE